MSQDKMKQWTVTQRNGKLDSLKLSEVPKPKPGPGQVLMQGEYCTNARPTS